MTQPILDPAVIASLRELDEDGAVLDEVIDLFSDDAPRRADRLRAALVAGDHLQARSVAHSLRGSASNIGVLIVASLARDIEHDLNAGRAVEPAAADVVRAALDAAIQALSAERSPRG